MSYLNLKKVKKVTGMNMAVKDPIKIVMVITLLSY